MILDSEWPWTIFIEAVLFCIVYTDNSHGNSVLSLQKSLQSFLDTPGYPAKGIFLLKKILSIKHIENWHFLSIFNLLWKQQPYSSFFS